MTRATVTNTRARWRRAGLGGLGDLPRNGRPPVADGEYLAELLRAVGLAPGDLGYAFGVWTTGRLAAHLERAQGKALCADRVRAHLHALGHVWARPKHTLRGRRSAAEHRRAQIELDRLKRGRNAEARPSSSSSFILVPLDNANLHKGRRAQAAWARYGRWVRPYWLPAYCPDLNDIERVWKREKEGTFANTLPPSFEAFEQRVRARFRSLAHVQCRAGERRRGRPMAWPRMLRDFRRVA